jgi:hypothetical protein
MPVIRIDDQVWREIQKRAEPLVDNENSVLRKVFGLDAKGKENIETSVDIVLKNTYSPYKFYLIPVPKAFRHFFPGYKIEFTLETNVGNIKTRMTSASRGTPIGDPYAGGFIQGNLKQWFEKNSNLKVGDILRFETVEPDSTYKLTVIKPNV